MQVKAGIRRSMAFRRTGKLSFSLLLATVGTFSTMEIFSSLSVSWFMIHCWAVS